MLEDEEEVALGLVVAPYPAIPDGRTSDQGIATSLSPPALNELVEDDEGVVDEVLDGEVEDDDGLVELEGVVLLLLDWVPLDPEELKEITAKSTLPEPGLMITSSIFPRSSPEELLMEELLSWLARISC